MRDAASSRWKQWRVTVVSRPVATAAELRFVRQPLAAAAAVVEQPGPDGIRRELVARVRREIAAGTYDAEDRWLAAEELLLHRVGG